MDEKTLFWAALAAGALLALNFILLMVLLLRSGKGHARLRDEISRQQSAAQQELTRLLTHELSATQRELSQQLSATRQEIGTGVQMSVSSFGRALTDSQDSAFRRQDELLELFSRRMGEFQNQLAVGDKEMRETVETRLSQLQQSNEKRLDEMRKTVDEKLEATLNERLTQSFKQVSEQLESVHKGIGEMQALASGVGDLKKMLSNVKTRGILGEIQLGAILEQVLTPEQYAVNVATVPGSRERVEYAVRLPGDGEQTVWLPIDAKFPGETYAALVDAYESADPVRVKAARAALESRIRTDAQAIRDKYISPPDTTDFAILFLPFEGLYSEVVNLGLIEPLSREYKVNIAGPTTMAALLNSLQMGFRTLAIQKRSGEVWRVLGEVKTEFLTFSAALEKVQKRIKDADREIDTLITTRTNRMNRRLRAVETFDAMPEDASPAEEEI